MLTLTSSLPAKEISFVEQGISQIPKGTIDSRKVDNQSKDKLREEGVNTAGTASPL